MSPSTANTYSNLFQFQYEMIKFEVQGNCEYLRQTPASTRPTTTDTNYYNWQTDRRDISNQISTLVQQYSSYPGTYIVTSCSSLITFLEDRLPLSNEKASGFPSEPILSTPTAPPPLSSAPSHFVCCPELSFEDPI